MLKAGAARLLPYNVRLAPLPFFCLPLLSFCFRSFDVSLILHIRCNLFRWVILLLFFAPINFSYSLLSRHTPSSFHICVRSPSFQCRSASWALFTIFSSFSLLAPLPPPLRCSDASSRPFPSTSKSTPSISLPFIAPGWGKPAIPLTTFIIIPRQAIPWTPFLLSVLHAFSIPCST